MRPEKFWILVVLSLMISGLIFLEIKNERQTLNLTYEEGVAQNKVSQLQMQHEVLMRLLQKIANESQTDSAFADILTKHGIRRSVSPRGQAPAAQAPVPASVPTSAQTGQSPFLPSTTSSPQ